MSATRLGDDKGDRLLKIREVVEQTTLHRATIYRLMNSGDFPKPVRITSRRVAWRRSEVEAWKEAREAIPA